MTDDVLDDTAHAAVDESAQGDLPGVAPAVQASGLDDVPRLAVHGTLASDAMVYDAGGGAVCLEATIHQQIAHHPHAVPFLVRWRVPDQGSYQLTRDYADSIAQRLPAGTLACALGQGLTPCSHHKHPVFRLLNVVGIQPMPAEA